ncbi:MAG: ankyrin repeat domain-containing protein [Candidatus Eremiobacteraeota bacterium]|nr:ankyrin repeat domain-containing protein [Candidatus Eremiobacteraeota bacterium]
MKKLFVVLWLSLFLSAGCFEIDQPPREQKDRSRCFNNLQTISFQLKVFAENHEGLYPATLKELLALAPDGKPYLNELPVCPAAGEDTYSKSYQVSADRTEYTFSCRGAWHGSTWSAHYVSTIEEERAFMEGVDVKKRDSFGSTALHDAASKGSVKRIEALLDKGAAINAKSDEGATPLHFAVRCGNKKAAKMLMDKGADVNVKTNAGWTPLLWAVSINNKEMAELFVAQGADLKAISEDGETPLDIAKKAGYKDIEEILEKAAAAGK